MLYPALTILSSVLTSVVLKINEGRGGDRFVVAGTNYVTAAVLAAAIGDVSQFGIGTKWTIISLATGFGFIGGFWMLMASLRRIGLAIPTSAARLSMLIPVTGSILLFDERPTMLQIAGITAGVAAFVMLGASQRSATPRSDSGTGRLDLRSVAMLVAIFLIVGSTDFTMKAVQSYGVDKDAMTFYIFVSASLFCWGVALVRRTPIVGRDVLLGVALAIPNYCSVYFLLLALKHLNASVVFPVVSSGAVITITLVAVIFWRERLNRAAWIGIALAAVAVALLGAGGGGN